MHYLTESLCERGVFERVSGRLKVLAGANPTIRTVPLDGSFSVDLTTESVGIRFSSLPTVFGERIVLRISRGGALNPVEGLGFDQRTQHLIEEYIVKGSGLSLVVGPTGSGKTTSLYGIIRRLVDLGKVVLSIEDPVERWIEGVSQTSLNEQAGLTFGAVAKAALRQGPDVLVIGEIRDAESAFTAMKMALSGHLVLSTIHARCVFEALERFSSLSGCKISELQGLSTIVAQRLISPLNQEPSIEPTLLLATQTLVISPEVQRLVKNDSIGRGEFYRSIQEGLFLPFENYARRWLEEGVICVEEYRGLVRLDE
jgi:type II secretory ATPase GspE/PulE/Tfp pilus assembly ATPase PilB-like protein